MSNDTPTTEQEELRKQVKELLQLRTRSAAPIDSHVNSMMRLINSEVRQVLDRADSQLDAIHSMAGELIGVYQERSNLKNIASVGALRVGTEEMKLFIEAERQRYAE